MVSANTNRLKLKKKMRAFLSRQKIIAYTEVLAVPAFAHSLYEFRTTCLDPWGTSRNTTARSSRTSNLEGWKKQKGWNLREVWLFAMKTLFCMCNTDVPRFVSEPWTKQEKYQRYGGHLRFPSGRPAEVLVRKTFISFLVFLWLPHVLSRMKTKFFQKSEQALRVPSKAFCMWISKAHDQPGATKMMSTRTMDTNNVKKMTHARGDAFRSSMKFFTSTGVYITFCLVANILQGFRFRLSNKVLQQLWDIREDDTVDSQTHLDSVLCKTNENCERCYIFLGK